MDALIGVHVRGIAAGGSGVADLPDGRVVFVPRTAPGDRASIRVVKSRSRWAEGALEHLEEPGPERRAALCALYSECGGCQLQHLPYAEQLRWKAQIVADTLARIGGIDLGEPPSVVPSERETQYRNRISYTLRRLRGGHVVAGFHALGRPAHVVDVKGECVLPIPALRDAWLMLRRAWGPAARLLPDAGRLRLTLREASRGVALVVEGGEDGWSARELAEAAPGLAAIWHRAGRGVHEARLLEGDFDEGGPAFAQVNAEVADALAQHVVEVSGSGGTAVDAYCGAGRYGRALTMGGRSVIGVERDPAACEEAARNAPVGFTVVQGTVESELARVLPADLLIVNPPRTGLDAGVVDVIRERAPGRLVYVSCDPATLARDLAALAGGYRLEGLRCFDLFPQTAHIETVATLIRIEAAS